MRRRESSINSFRHGEALNDRPFLALELLASKHGGSCGDIRRLQKIVSLKAACPSLRALAWRRRESSPGSVESSVYLKLLDVASAVSSAFLYSGGAVVSSSIIRAERSVSRGWCGQATRITHTLCRGLGAKRLRAPFAGSIYQCPRASSSSLGCAMNRSRKFSPVAVVSKGLAAIVSSLSASQRSSAAILLYGSGASAMGGHENRLRAALL